MGLMHQNSSQVIKHPGLFLRQYNTCNNTDEHENIKYNIIYQLKQVASASNAPLVTLQCT